MQDAVKLNQRAELGLLLRARCFAAAAAPGGGCGACAGGGGHPPIDASWQAHLLCMAINLDRIECLEVGACGRRWRCLGAAAACLAGSPSNSHRAMAGNTRSCCALPAPCADHACTRL